jgi:DNA-binding MarR family transcriptional regulator
MVARLRAGGVVETAAKSNDARAKLVRITEKGKDILESTAQLLQPDFQAVEQALGAKRLQSLLEELEAVHDAFSTTNLALED